MYNQSIASDVGTCKCRTITENKALNRNITAQVLENVVRVCQISNVKESTWFKQHVSTRNLD